MVSVGCCTDQIGYLVSFWSAGLSVAILAQAVFALLLLCRFRRLGLLFTRGWKMSLLAFPHRPFMDGTTFLMEACT